MLSLLTQRVGLRTSTLFSTTIIRSNAPLFASRTVTRTFLTTPRVAYPAVKKASAATKPRAQTKKTAAKKPVAKRAAKKAAPKEAAAKKPKKKVVTAKPKKITLGPKDNPPKKPMSAYIHFWVDYRAARPEKSSTLEDASKLAKEAAATWRNLSADERKPYEDSYRTAKEEYRTVKDKWLKNVDSSKLKELNRRRKAKGKRRIGRQGTAKTRSAYIQFMGEFLHEYVQTHPTHATIGKEAVRAGSTKWNTLTDAEKAPYVAAHVRAKAESEPSASA